jgi:hypothetical protein
MLEPLQAASRKLDAAFGWMHRLPRVGKRDTMKLVRESPGGGPFIEG